MTDRQNTYRRMADKIRNSGFIVPAFLIFAAMIPVAIYLGLDDYSTSRGGLELLPFERALAHTEAVVAFLPQLWQMGAGLAVTMLRFEEDRGPWLFAAITWMLAHAFDVGTDMVYQLPPNPAGIEILMGLAYTEMVFTIGSEIMFVVGLGMTFELRRDFLRQVKTRAGRQESPRTQQPGLLPEQAPAQRRNR